MGAAGGVWGEWGDQGRPLAAPVPQIFGFLVPKAKGLNKMHTSVPVSSPQTPFFLKLRSRVSTRSRGCGARAGRVGPFQEQSRDRPSRAGPAGQRLIPGRAPALSRPMLCRGEFSLQEGLSVTRLSVVPFCGSALSVASPTPSRPHSLPGEF